MFPTIALGAVGRALGAPDEAAISDLYPCPADQACGTGALPPTQKSQRFGPPSTRPDARPPARGLDGMGALQSLLAQRSSGPSSPLRWMWAIGLNT